MILPLCAYHGKVYVPKVDKKHLILDVFEYRRSVTNGQDCFIKVNTLQILSLNPASEDLPNPLHFSVVGGFPTGLNSLYLIVEYNNTLNKQARLTAYTIQLQIKNTFISQCSAYSSPVFSKEPHSSPRLHVIEGPRIFWVTDNSINIFSCTSRVSENHGIQVIQLRCKERLKEILYCNVVGALGVERTETIFLLIVQLNNSSKICVFILSEDSKSFLFDKDVHFLSRDTFLPRQYSCYVTCINVSLPYCLKKSLYHEKKKKPLENLCWIKNTTVISTTQKQFLVFVGGCLRYRCQIPFSEVWCITKLITFSPSQVVFVLQSSKGACAVKKEHDGTLKCFQVWDDAVSMVTGDFVGKGLPQLLVLKNINSTSWLENCILTDLHKVFFPVSQAITKELPGSKQNTIVGLRSRLIFGQASLVETDERIREKQTAIDNLLRSLTMAPLTTGNTVTPVLVDILTHHSSKQLPSSQKVPLNIYPESALKVINQWKCVIENQLIIGWTMKNISNSFIADLQVYTSVEIQCIEFASKVFWHQSNGLPCQPGTICKTWKEENALKKNSMSSIVIAIPLPLMLNKTVSVTGVIFWNVQSSDVSCGKITPQQTRFLQTFSIKEIIEERHKNFTELPLVQQLMSLRVSQQCRTLSIYSVHTDLMMLESILESCIEAKTLSHDEHFSTQVMAFLDFTSPLYGVNFSIHHICSTEVTVEIFFREEKQILLCIHWLYEALPDDIIILLADSKTADAAKCRHLFLSSMKNEAETVSSLVSQKCAVNPFVMTQTGSVKDIRKHFKEECQIVMQDSVPQACGHYRRIRNFLSENELYTDKIFSTLKPL